jgi:histone acetyltransferase (RNA polymerase elongator complex component)
MSSSFLAGPRNADQGGKEGDLDGTDGIDWTDGMERVLKPLIIPFFLRNRGCPHRCVFCNERMIAGNAEDITETRMHETVKSYITGSSRKYNRVEIAFYGGSFTGMAAGTQIELLRMAGALMNEGVVHSIHLSTRPDDMDGQWLDTLGKMGVRAIEIGAQSMDDEVLRNSGRGHTAEDVRRAVGLLKDRGFETGIHLMAGLPGDSREKFEASVVDVIRLRPDTVRIHPVLVFRDTELADRHEEGEYRPLTLQEAVSWCKVALVRFTMAKIPVIRLGLHATDEMEKKGNVLAGPWHPAFRGLVEAALFRDMALELISKAGGISAGQVFHVAPADMSNFNGMGRENIAFLEGRFGSGAVTAKQDSAMQRGTLLLRDGQQSYGTSIAEAGVV